MKYFFVIGLFLSLNAFSKTVTLKFDKTANKTGKIYFLVFNDARSFPDSPNNAVLSGIVPVERGQDSAEVNVELPLGHYAISAFLDENGNGVMDRRMFGIPKERFGFSNNPSITTGAPTFQEAEIEVSEATNSFKIDLIKIF